MTIRYAEIDARIAQESHVVVLMIIAARETDEKLSDLARRATTCRRALAQLLDAMADGPWYRTLLESTACLYVSGGNHG